VPVYDQDITAFCFYYHHAVRSQVKQTEAGSSQRRETIKITHKLSLIFSNQTEFVRVV